MGGLLHLVQRGGEGLGGAGLQPTQAPLRCTKCNSSPSTANVLITALLCGFDVPIKGFLNHARHNVNIGTLKCNLLLRGAS